MARQLRTVDHEFSHVSFKSPPSDGCEGGFEMCCFR